MEIVVERIAKKNTYTIGRLYLLADGDVKRKALSGKNAGDKRSFEHSFDLEKLSKDSYFCDTLEPTWRNLKGVELKPEEENARFSRESGKVARKIPGLTAIPEGSYRVLITKSRRFKKCLLRLQTGLVTFKSIVQARCASSDWTMMPRWELSWPATSQSWMKMAIQSMTLAARYLRDLTSSRRSLSCAS